MNSENENDVTDVVSTEGFKAASLSDINKSYTMSIYHQGAQNGLTEVKPSNSLKAIIESIYNAKNQEEKEDVCLPQMDFNEINRNNGLELMEEWRKNLMNHAVGLNQVYLEFINEIMRAQINNFMKSMLLIENEMRAEKENALRCLRNAIEGNTAAVLRGATNYTDISSRYFSDYIGNVASNTNWPHVHPIYNDNRGNNAVYIPTNFDANNNAYFGANMLPLQAPDFRRQQGQNQLDLVPARRARNTPTNYIRAHLNSRYRVTPYETPYRNSMHRHNTTPELNANLGAELNAHHNYFHHSGAYF